MGLPLDHLFRLDQNYGCLNIIDYFPDLAVVRLLNGGVNGAARERSPRLILDGQEPGPVIPIWAQKGIFLRRVHLTHQEWRVNAALL